LTRRIEELKPMKERGMPAGSTSKYKNIFSSTPFKPMYRGIKGDKLMKANEAFFGVPLANGIAVYPTLLDNLESAIKIEVFR
jgi:hypothetical protein